MGEEKKRQGTIQRKTRETDIDLGLVVDGSGKTEIDCGVPFLNHMLTLLGVHGFFDLTVRASGDTDVDDHHTVEDVGICLGQAFSQALGDKSGISRYGCSYLPMDETLVRAVVDISNRPYVHYNAPVPDQKVGTFDTALAQEFMRAFAQHAGITLHIDLIHGANSHHIIEAVFKALARALSQAVIKLDTLTGSLSSKGVL